MSKKIQPWKKLESKIYEYSPYRKIKDVLYEMPDGQQRWYPLKKEENVACIFALTVDNQVILARQYRPGPDQIIDELPGGLIERRRRRRERRKDPNSFE